MDAALQEGIKLILDEDGQFTARVVLCVRDETGRVLLQHAVQRGLFGAVALMVNRGATALRPPGPVSVGSHALDM